MPLTGSAAPWRRATAQGDDEQSMVISDSHRFVFIHIQKTGGTSLSRVLVESLDAEHYGGTESHTRLSRAHAVYPRTRTYRAAAFVRNPWDRLVSWYAEILQNGRRVPWWERLWNKQYNVLRHQVLAHTDSFESFLRLGPAFRSRLGYHPFRTNQVDWLTNGDGRMAVDFVGRFEHFEHDARDLCAMFGVELSSVPHLNASTRRNYRDYYTPQTRDLVARRFKRDVEAFGYDF